MPTQTQQGMFHGMIGLCALCLASACGDAGAGTDESSTEATSSTGAGSTGEGSTGEVTTGDVEPTIQLTRLTDPSWEVVDFHQRSAEFGEGYDLWTDRTVETLAPPEHIVHPNLGIGPGSAHEGPWDHEFADAWAQHGWTDSAVFTLEEASTPMAIFSMFMVVPSANAPLGKTPDSDAGPMIPHTIFPINMAFEYLIDDLPVLGGQWEFDVPRLDEIDPPYAVEGHSHFPIYDARYVDLEPSSGEHYEVNITMKDATGSGWGARYGFKIH